MLKYRRSLTCNLESFRTIAKGWVNFNLIREELRGIYTFSWGKRGGAETMFGGGYAHHLPAMRNSYMKDKSLPYSMFELLHLT